MGNASRDAGVLTTERARAAQGTLVARQLCQISPKANVTKIGTPAVTESGRRGGRPLDDRRGLVQIVQIGLCFSRVQGA